MKKVILQSTIVLSALLVSACGDKQVSRNVTSEPASPAAENSAGSGSGENNASAAPDATAPTVSVSFPTTSINLNTVNKHDYSWNSVNFLSEPLLFAVDATNVNAYTISLICSEVGAEVTLRFDGVSNYTTSQKGICGESKLLNLTFDFYTAEKQFRKGELLLTITSKDSSNNISTVQKTGILAIQPTLVTLSSFKSYYLQSESSSVVFAGTCTSYAGDLTINFLGTTSTVVCNSNNTFSKTYNMSSQSLGLYSFTISQPDLIIDVEPTITGSIDKVTDAVVSEIVIRSAADLARYAPMAITARIANNFTLPSDFPYGVTLRAKINGANKTISNVNTVSTSGNANLFSSIEFGGALKNIQFFVNRIEGIEQAALVGDNKGLMDNVSIWPSLSTSRISGSLYVGGLAAVNNSTGRILNSGVHMTFNVKDDELLGLTLRRGGDLINAVGGLVGYNVGLIDACAAYPEIQGEIVAGKVRVDGMGGIAGLNIGKIYYSEASGSINGDDYLGGIVGRALNGGTIENVKAQMRINGDDYVGGVAGDVLGGTLKRALAVGRITQNQGDGSGSLYVGGAAGFASPGVPMVEYDDYGVVYSRSVEYVYFDTQVTELSTSALGTGKTSSELGDQSTYAGFDFVTPVWEMSNGYAQRYSRTAIDPFGH